MRSRKLDLMTFLKKKNSIFIHNHEFFFFKFSRDHTARLWNVIERRCLKIIQHTVDVRSVFFNSFAIFTGEENSGADSSGLNFVIKKLCYNFPHYIANALHFSLIKGPDRLRLCLLRKIAACYFLLVI